ncbi:MAG: MFS transporter [Clostridia bacterium]|nr:MFS transporter [Clostridia bacterium]
MKTNYTKLKFACYTTNMSMSVVASLSPVLFTTFYREYGISFSLLGLLVLVNFFTQLTVDLIFSFFSHRFNIPLAIKLTPVITLLGLLIYALFPFLLPEYTYVGLVIGTIVFSASNGLAEVLISPVIAAIPAKDPDREMSKLHSIYAWGVVFVIIFSTLFLSIFKSQSWQILALVLMLIPLSSVLLFVGTDIPEMKTEERVSGVLKFLKNKSLWLCVAAIFFGGAAECTMAQWCSGYLEQAFMIDKVKGDIFGAALFALMLGTGRTLYSKIGKNIAPVLFFGMLGATVCYLVAALSGVPFIGLVACALTGFCVSMLWPGSLIVASDRFPAGGVFIYAMMAAGGDLGASVGPQLVGIVTDTAIAAFDADTLMQTFGLSPEQFGIKLGMLVGMIFPLIGIFVTARILKSKKASSANADKPMEI